MDKAIEKLNELVLDRNLEFLAIFGDTKGGDKPFLEWLRFQACKNCSKIPTFVMSTFYHNMPAHVRRVSAGSGTGVKPPWNATTLCVACHNLQHQSGESAVASQEDFDRFADESLMLYVIKKLRTRFGPDWQETLPWVFEKNGIEVDLEEE